MKPCVLALGLTFAATPLLAGGLMFEPVAPEGLDAKTEAVVARMQEGLSGKMETFEQAGYGAFGAIAVPVGRSLEGGVMSAVANHESPEAARAAVREGCKAQWHADDCTVVGLLLPAE